MEIKRKAPAWKIKLSIKTLSPFFKEFESLQLFVEINFQIIIVVMSQALQAPACHENMVKVGGYILGEFGNLIAGDQRSSPLVQV